MQINSKTLSNGLRLIHSEDRGTQMVAVNTLYRVGSRNESADHTGFAHLFEHLMFGGSVNIPDYDKALQEACGENNAYTDVDFTNYYVTIPAQNIETAFWLESDRMLSLAFTPESLEVQRKVVMEEFKQVYLNQPYGDITHILFGKTYKVHPYRWPTIGMELRHIAEATMEEVKDFFHRFYRPDNAIVSVVGNISWEQTQELVEKWYGDIPGGKQGHGCDSAHEGVDGPIPDEPCQQRQRRVTVRRQVPNSLILIAFHVPPVSSDDFPVCDMISDVLGNGQSSRLYRELVEKKRLFVSVDASVIGRIDGSLLLVEGLMGEDVDVEDCEQALWREIDILKSVTPDDYELQKVKNKFAANHELEMANYLQRAQDLAHFEAWGDASMIDRDVMRYNAVTPKELRSAAMRFMTRRNSTVLRYLKIE